MSKSQTLLTAQQASNYILSKHGFHISPRALNNRAKSGDITASKTNSMEGRPTIGKPGRYPWLFDTAELDKLSISTPNLDPVILARIDHMFLSSTS